MKSLFDKINSIKDIELWYQAKADLNEYFDPMSSRYKDPEFLTQIEEEVDRALEK